MEISSDSGEYPTSFLATTLNLYVYPEIMLTVVRYSLSGSTTRSSSMNTFIP
jgi:hypothetical protein